MLWTIALASAAELYEAIEGDQTFCREVRRKWNGRRDVWRKWNKRRDEKRKREKKRNEKRKWCWM